MMMSSKRTMSCHEVIVHYIQTPLCNRNRKVVFPLSLGKEHNECLILKYVHKMGPFTVFFLSNIHSHLESCLRPIFDFKDLSTESIRNELT